VYVFHKHFRALDEERMIKEVNGLKVYQISDYHFNTSNGPHYINMCKAADIVVSATHKNAEYIEQATGKKPIVIYDTWGAEFDEQKPLFDPKGELVALWFGHKSNIKGLQDRIHDLDGCRIIVVTNSDKPNIVPYSIQNMKVAFSKCDFVVIPQNLDEPGKQVKTHNRIVDSFRAGKFVIASPVDSYLLFRDWAWLGDIKEGVEWLRNQSKEDIERMISEAQKFINKTFSPSIIADQWEQTFKEGIRGKVSLSNDRFKRYQLSTASPE
jgi:hypothetical protein